uniref:Uncharacterized protein n=1 Tax=uncultured marine microorganism HF4000_APKG7H23 TaxID=455551 RepID=B3T9W3_9ZZZZ|nr:hypothetical protein ALOHA_HF4000APKG7H23ctg3g37 [uncultured marine microorganism HF4000_APKG7H23]
MGSRCSSPWDGPLAWTYTTAVPVRVPLRHSMSAEGLVPLIRKEGVPWEAA